MSYSVQIVFNVHNQVKLKTLTVNPYNRVVLYTFSYGDKPQTAQ